MVVILIWTQLLFVDSKFHQCEIFGEDVNPNLCIINLQNVLNVQQFSSNRTNISADNVDNFEQFTKRIWNSSHQRIAVDFRRVNLKFKKLGKCDYFLILLPSAEARQMVDSLMKVELLPQWNRFAKIILVIQSFQSSLPQDILLLHKLTVSKLGLTRSVLLSIHGNSLSVYYYNQFTNELVRKNDCSWIARFLNDNHLRDVGGYRFAVAKRDIFSYIMLEPGDNYCFGPMAEVVSTFCKHINATLAWRPLVVTNSVEKVYIQWFNQKSLSMAPYFFVTLQDHIYPHNFDGLCLLLPEKTIDSYFKHLGKPFTISAWISILVTATVIQLLNLRFRRTFRRSILAAVFFGTSNSVGQTLFERMLLLTLSILLFILMEAYQAKMISFILTNKYEPHMRTVEQFLQSPLPICTHSELVVSFLGTYSQDLARKTVLEAEQPTLQTNCSYFTLCETAYRYVHENTENFDSETQLRRFYVLEEYVLWNVRTSSLDRLEPFAERFREINDRLFDGGLWQHWREPFLKQMELPAEMEGDVVSFRDLTMLWWLLVFGLLVSFVVLIVEKVYAWCDALHAQLE